MVFVFLLALVSLIGSVLSCSETIWQMGYGTQKVLRIPHVYVAMVPIGGKTPDLQGMRCLRAELYIDGFRDQLTRTPSFKIEPHNSCAMTANSVASRRNIPGGVFGNLCASKAELEALMPLARVMNAANTEAAKYVLLRNDCMNYAANFMTMALERYAFGEARRLKAENKLIKRGSSKNTKTLLAEIMKVMYTDPELIKAAEELKKIEKSESSSKELTKQSSKKIETKQASNKALAKQASNKALAKHAGKKL